jgi:hypothetical protein
MNPVLPECNITSQSVSYLRLMQMQRYLTQSRDDCECEEYQDHTCEKQLVHLSNLSNFNQSRVRATEYIIKIDELVEARNK